MNKQLHLAVNILFIILGILTVAYVYGLIVLWDDMIERPTRVSYFISDISIVFPLGLLSGIGVKKGKQWAVWLFVLTLGAILFDVAHQVYYLFFDNYFGVPRILLIVLLLLTIVYVGYGLHAAMKFQAHQAS